MAEEILSPKDARAQGLKYYYTGTPCKRGHLGKRMVANFNCVSCIRQKANAKRAENNKEIRRKEREKYAANIDHYREKNRKAYAKNPEKHRQRRREWYSKPENQEKAKVTRRLYEAKLGDVIAQKNRQNAKRYRTMFPEKAKQAIDNWWDKNPGRKKTYHRNRRARKRGNGGTHTANDINDILKLQKGKCAYCKARLGKSNERHVDHIIPLIEGGTNDRRNLQILCRPCNLEKGRRDPLVHARKLGMLL
jgi:5-methylcytosine-specific restriction endonuclease McrA